MGDKPSLVSLTYTSPDPSVEYHELKVRISTAVVTAVNLDFLDRALLDSIDENSSIADILLAWQTLIFRATQQGLI